MPAFTHVLGWALVNSIWQMGLLWLLFQVLTITFKRLSPAQSHNLALLALFAGSVWFLFGFLFDLSKTDGQSSASGFSISENMPAIWSVKLALDQVVPFLSALYIIILLYFSIRYFRQWAGLREIRSDASAQSQVSFQAFCDSFADRMQIKRTVQLRISKMIDSPLTIGFLKPLIFLPLASVNHLSTDQVEAILLHELAHIRRNDYLSNLFVSLAATCFFFNPFVKIFVRIIQEEREHDCDDRVLSLITDPHKYASALLSLEKGRQDFPFALGAASKGSGFLLLRIKRLMGIQDSRIKYRVQWPWLFCSMLCLLLFLSFGLPLKHHIPLGPANNVGRHPDLLANTGGTRKPKHKKPAHSHARPAPNSNEIMDTSSDQFSDPMWVLSGASNLKNPSGSLVNINSMGKANGKGLQIVQARQPSLVMIRNSEYPNEDAISNQPDSVPLETLVMENQDVVRAFSLSSLYNELTELKQVDWRELDNDSLSNFYMTEALKMDSAWTRVVKLFPVKLENKFGTDPANRLITSSYEFNSGNMQISPAIQRDNMAPGTDAGTNANRESLRRHWQKHYILIMKKIQLIQKIMTPASVGRKIVYI